MVVDIKGQKEYANQYFKNTQILRDYEAKSPNAITTDPDQGLKTCKAETSKGYGQATHILLTQDQTTKLWSLFIYGLGGSAYYGLSPNISQDQEKQRAEQGIQSQGVSKSVYYTANPQIKTNINNDPTYSFLGSLAMYKKAVEAGIKGISPNDWTALIGADSNGKTQAEADYNNSPIIQLANNQEQHTPDQLEKHKPEDLKPADYDQIKADLKKWTDLFKNETPEQVKANSDRHKEQSSIYQAGFFKLIDIYTAEIKKRTELFYQDLALDNNWINEKYGDKNTDYLSRLTRKLNEKSDTEAIINAFRVVALIVATEKAQETTDKYKGRLTTLAANLKKNNRNKFIKISDTWDLIADQPDPQEENNPLYLPIIKQKQDYITQIKNIIAQGQ